MTTVPDGYGQEIALFCIMEDATAIRAVMTLFKARPTQHNLTTYLAYSITTSSGNSKSSPTLARLRTITRYTWRARMQVKTRLPIIIPCMHSDNHAI